MLVQWVSATDAFPSVKWGLEEGVYDHEAPAQSTSYAPGDLCGPPATTVCLISHV